MAWITRPIPDALRLPACPTCANRLRVRMVLVGVFICGDCLQAGRETFAFRARWVADRPAALGEARGRAG